MSLSLCGSCNTMKHTRTAMVNGKYYKCICSECIGESAAYDGISSGVAGYERRRGYEDNAQDTIQPYDANGPSSEFARLYPGTAKKVFGEQVYNQLRSKI